MDATTVFVSGKIYWAKILGKPVTNYDGDGKEWTYELEPDDTSFLKEHKLLDRLKTKYDDRGPFLTLKKPEITSTGEKNEPIRVYDENNEPWDPTKLIGNGTQVDVKLRIVDWGKTKKKSIYTTAIRVTDLVPFVSNEFGGMAENRAAAVKSSKKVDKTILEELDDLDDDLALD